jgi:hypothetical protein
VTGITLRSTDGDEVEVEIDRNRSLGLDEFRDPKRPSSPPIRLSAFEGLSLDELRREWRRLYRNEPPKISRDLLIRGIGYQL